MSGAAIGIICKAPQPGRSKTRLATAIGAVAASELSACFLRDVAAAIDAVPGDARQARLWRLCSGRHRAHHAAAASAGVRTVAAGRRRSRPRADWRDARALLGGHDCVLLVNGDSPTLPPRFLAQAIEALREPGDRMVLGPASDGGYYLIGLKHPHQHLFTQIAWGTDSVARSTCERAAEIGLATTLLAGMVRCRRRPKRLRWLQDELAGHSTRFRGGGFAAASRAFLKAAPQMSA